MYSIGIDIGGTNIVGAILNDSGKIVMKSSIQTLKDRTTEEIIRDIIELVKELLLKSKLIEADIHSLGIGSPGIIDAKNGIVIQTSNLPFYNLNLKKVFSSVFPWPIFVQNDAYCATIGELYAGEAKFYRNVLNVMIGTGIGGGIIIDGKIYMGLNNSGEFGHHTICFDGDLCSCGKRGCWEMYASATALISAIRAREQKSILMGLCENDMNKITAKTIFDSAEIGDINAKEILDEYIEYISIGLMNLIVIFQPELLIIGGGISLQGDKLLNRLHKRINYNHFFPKEHLPKISCSWLGNDAGVIGAAMLGYQTINNL